MPPLREVVKFPSAGKPLAVRDIRDGRDDTVSLSVRIKLLLPSTTLER